MNNYDKQRIENAIWTLQRYSYEIKEMAENLDLCSYECSTTFNFLNEIAENL